jgi:hypothetical protein
MTEPTCWIKLLWTLCIITQKHFARLKSRSHKVKNPLPKKGRFFHRFTNEVIAKLTLFRVLTYATPRTTKTLMGWRVGFDSINRSCIFRKFSNSKPLILSYQILALHVSRGGGCSEQYVRRCPQRLSLEDIDRAPILRYFARVI